MVLVPYRDYGRILYMALESLKDLSFMVHGNPQCSMKLLVSQRTAI